MFVRSVKRYVPLAAAIWFFPRVTLFWIACGTVDVVRNRRITGNLLNRYFFGNGLFTWILSPVNLLMDLLALPYRNKGIYTPEDLPESHRQEIMEVLRAADRQDFPQMLSDHMKNQDRVMLFFKWYGANNPKFADVPEFHRNWKYIRTIGVSAFSEHQSTSEHFGPLRITLRVLYNVGPLPDEHAFIQVGDHTNCWKDNRLFIFDDTLMHRSCNESSGVRYCMFIDILRPSPWPRLLNILLVCVRLLASRSNSQFYRNWSVLR